MIINPAIFVNKYSGGSQKTLKKVRNIIKEHNLTIPIYTNEEASTKEIICEIEKNYNTIIGIGGDGTCNNIINLIDLKKTKFGIIPGGTGNDFVKMFPKMQPLKFLRNIQSAKTTEVDVWEIKLNNELKTKFISCIGFGLDAEVAYRAKTINWLKGFPKYLVASIQTIFSAKGRRLKVITDSITFEDEFIFCAIGNGQSAGGGFRLTPHAKVDDSTMDVCLVKSASTITLLTMLPRALTGSHLSHPLVTYNKTKNFTIECVEGVPLHVDGELLGRDIKIAEINLHPDKLQLLIPSND